MKSVFNFNADKPIYMQVRELIEDQIIHKQLNEGDQSPSINQLVHYYKINHATVSKGINQLVDEKILYKKRGIGMFVAAGARKKILKHRRQSFIEEHIVTLVQEADKLEISTDEILTYINEAKGRGKQ
ncbi:MAG TPA: GntR family transcriptional regulator [Virgibacillus sp.]|nr:GntR family transcriptional regulator [Virgibacillus sp.]